MSTHEVKTLFIGVNGEQVVDSATTRKQIEEIEALECALEHEGSKLTWKDVNDPAQPRTIFQSILRDRKRRVDEHTLMADRPAFAVITTLNGMAVRLEYYEGHDALKLVFDLRARGLQGKSMPAFLDEDPHAYDPAKFLKEFMGIPEEVSKPILDAVHGERGDSL